MKYEIIFNHQIWTIEDIQKLIKNGETQLCKEANIPMPAYSVANRLVTLTFYRPAVSDDVTQSDTKNDTKNKRTVRQEEIIKLVAENPTISIATLALRLKVSKPTIMREMFSLSDVLEHIGPTNGGYWRIRG